MKAALSTSDITIEETEEIEATLNDVEVFAKVLISPSSAAPETVQHLSYSFDSNSIFQINDTLKINMAAIHYELAVLEAMGRFSENSAPSIGNSAPVACPDVASCIFHLCEASMLGHRAAALALGKLRHGLQTELLKVVNY